MRTFGKAAVAAAMVCGLAAAGEARAASYSITLSGTAYPGLGVSYTNFFTTFNDALGTLESVDLNASALFGANQVFNQSSPIVTNPETLPTSATVYVDFGPSNSISQVISGTGQVVASDASTYTVSHSELAKFAITLSSIVSWFEGNGGSFNFNLGGTSTVDGLRSASPLDQYKVTILGTLTYNYDPVAVPEPASVVLLALPLGAAGLIMTRRRKSAGAA